MLAKINKLCPLISVVLPGFNEEESITQAVTRCKSSLEALNVEFELILVNDGSVDRSGEIIAKLAATDQRIIAISNPINLGVGASILIGAHAARGHYVLFESMDLPLDPDDISKLLPHLPDVDVLVYERIDRSAHSMWRRITSITHNLIVRILFRPGIRDLNFAQIYRREFIQRANPRSRSPAFVTPELLIRAVDEGAKIIRCEVKFHPRLKGLASFGKPRDILWTLGDTIAFWCERRRDRINQP